MGRITLLYVSFFALFPSLFAQDLPVAQPDSAVVKYEYWKPRYYDSIPVSSGWNTQSELDFEEMVVRYHSKEYEYVESISDKLSFIDTLFERITRFFDNLFPKRNYQFDRSFYTLLAVAGGIIFLFLVYKLFFSGKKILLQLDDEKEDVENQIEFVERNLMQVKLRQYIQSALEKKNYSLAIRYQQLYNIQRLHDKGYIEWKYTKTNRELVEEVDNADLRREFLHCASIYDYVWFGEFVITAEDYKRYEQVFKQFQRRWG